MFKLVLRLKEIRFKNTYKLPMCVKLYTKKRKIFLSKRKNQNQN